MELDISEIKKIIPHRFPFLLIDKVVDLKPREKLTAIKNVSANEQFFVGHFPNETPIWIVFQTRQNAMCKHIFGVLPRPATFPEPREG